MLHLQIWSLTFIFLIVKSAAFSSSIGSVRTIVKRLDRPYKSTGLYVEADMETRPGMKGYYRRPSRAIEKGGGFFVPGLEGERIRIISAVALIAMLVVNRAGVQVSTTSQVVSELIGLAMAVILFIQGVSDILGSGAAAAVPQTSSSFLSVIQSVAGTKYSTALESIVRTIVQTCESVSYVLVYQQQSDPNDSATAKVIIELGPVSVKATSNKSLGDIGKVLASSSIAAVPVPDKGSNNSKDIAATSSLTFLTAAALRPQAAVSAASPAVASSLPVPAPVDTQSIAVATDSRGWTWIIASNSQKDDFEKNSKWISSLLSAHL